MFSVNYLSVIVALIAYTVLGMLWYGPLLGKRWLELSGMKDVDMGSPEMKKAQAAGYISSLVSSFVALLSLAVVLKAMGLEGWLDGLVGGAAIGFGFVAMALIGGAAWHHTPWGLVAINAGYRVVGLAVGGFVIGAM